METIGMGILLFSLLSFVSVVGALTIIVLLFEIENKSGWDVVGITFGILIPMCRITNTLTVIIGNAGTIISSPFPKRSIWQIIIPFRG